MLGYQNMVINVVALPIDLLNFYEYNLSLLKQ